jgi:hypothetical protein
VSCVGFPAIAHRDVNHDARNSYRRGECRYREKQAVVGQYLDVWLPGHACAVGWSSALLPDGALRLILPAPN